MNTKSKYFLVIALLVGVSFVFGFFIGRNSVKGYYNKLFEIDNGFGQLYIYTEMRDIASLIKEKKYSSAQCSAEMDATSSYKALKRCIDDDVCKAHVGGKVEELASEVFNEAKIPFTQRAECSKQ